MLNYMKSEWYRIFHSSAIYITILIFSGLTLLFNIVLYLFDHFTPDFPYATTSFSFSNIVANPMIFCYSAFVLVYILYEKSTKNGNLKNVVAFGISRTKIFIGQFIVSLTVAVIVLIITEVLYISSTFLLLPNKGPVTVYDVLWEIVAVSLVAVSGLICSILLVQLFERSFIGMLVWLCVFNFIPKILFFVGMVVKPVRQVAMWLPQNFFSIMQVNTTECVTVWDTASGLSKCLISGLIGIVVFGVWGILSLRKKNL